MSHRSIELDKHVAQRVTITFKSGAVETGILWLNEKGYRGYCLQTPAYNVIFAKSHVKRIVRE